MHRPPRGESGSLKWKIVVLVTFLLKEDKRQLLPPVLSLIRSNLLSTFFLKNKSNWVFLLIVIKYPEFQKIKHIILLLITQESRFYSDPLSPTILCILYHYQHLK